MPDRILPQYGKVLDHEMKEAIGVAMGAASVCWERMDHTGQFDDVRAGQIVDELMGLATQFVQDSLTVTEDTMATVYQALQAVHLDDETIINAVTAMQNRGILFREVNTNARPSNT